MAKKPKSAGKPAKVATWAISHIKGTPVAQIGQVEAPDADSAIKEAIRLNPKYETAYTNRGNVYLGKGDYDRAIADCDQAIRLNPKYALAYNNRGNAYGKKGDYDRAIADHTEAIRLDPNFALAYKNRGISYEKKGELEKSLAEYNLAARLDPAMQEAVVGAKRVQQALRSTSTAVTPNAANIRAECEAKWDTEVVQPSFPRNMTHESFMLQCLARAAPLVEAKPTSSKIAAQPAVQSSNSKPEVMQLLQIGLFDWKPYDDGKVYAHFVIQNYSYHDIRDVTLSCTTRSNLINSSFEFEQKTFGSINARQIKQFADVPIPSAFSSGSLSCRIANFEFE